MKALVLQRLFNLSDRILPEACRFDIRYKYILDLELNDMGFDHSVFGKFRDRLLYENTEPTDRLTPRPGTAIRSKTKKFNGYKTHVTKDFRKINLLPTLP